MNDKAEILIVDDEMGMRETLSDILEDMGYHAVIAVDGHQAVQKAKENTFDIIFMDVRMPGMDGVDAFKEIKKIHPEAAVVLMTAYARDDRIREAQREGVYSVLDKPVDVKMMISFVEDVKVGDHILVVDDDPDTHAIFKDLLKARGCKVSIVRTGEEAIRTVREHQYDMIFIAMELSIMDGLETYLAIKKINPEVVVVMMSAHPRAASDLVIEALMQDAYTCLYKPFNVGEIIRLVDGIRRKKLQSSE